jgi:dTDP-glucose 4,6-dehydratase
MEKGRKGEIYNIGGSRSLPNLEVVREILAATGGSDYLIRYVVDRPGHDRRYALSSAKLMHETAGPPRPPLKTDWRIPLTGIVGTGRGWSW